MGQRWLRVLCEGTLWASILVGGACTGAREPAPAVPSSKEPQAASAAPGAAARGEGELFGKAPDPQRALVPLDELIRHGERYAEQTVKTRGVVARVCQRMGCWMELRAAGDAETSPLRVPMAGHAFFLPKDAAGREAVVEGTVVVRPLSEGHARHLRSEGATVTGDISLEATGVWLAER